MRKHFGISRQWPPRKCGGPTSGGTGGCVASSQACRLREYGCATKDPQDHLCGQIAKVRKGRSASVFFRVRFLIFPNWSMTCRGVGVPRDWRCSEVSCAVGAKFAASAAAAAWSHRFETAIRLPQGCLMLAALAGVRADENEHPLLVPRGFLCVSGSKTFSEFHLCVVSDSEKDLWPRDIRQCYANELLGKGVARVQIPRGRSAAWLTDPNVHPRPAG